MAGFAIAALVAILCLILVTAEEWWAMGRQVLCLILVFVVLALAVGGFQYFWA